VSLADIIYMSGTDERCRELLLRLRWPKGVKCARCKMPAVELATTKQLFYCKGCNYQFTVTSGTIFNDSHLPLQKWFLATLLICETRAGFSTNQMKRILGVSYKTAWYLCHRIRYAMTVVNQQDGIIKVDETCTGRKRGMVGKRRRVSRKHLTSYLNEMTFRFNRRKSRTLFLDTLRHMVTAPALTFERLTA
jgi:transposase-like protein